VTALGALAACDALRTLYRLQASIKWPNDVLVEGRKVAGVLVEARWIGEGRSVEGAGDDRPSTLVLGIGINLAPASVSEARCYERATSLQVACLEEFLRGPVDPLELLHAVLAELVVWRGRLGTPAFVGAWESRLAYRGEWVQVFQGDVATQEGLVVGLAPDGSLKLRSRSGEVVAIRAGEARLRLA
jgi:BirA family biotin operon repressor/biotin-[acetyl-CoA-carboxylase] ligase